VLVALGMSGCRLVGGGHSEGPEREGDTAAGTIPEGSYRGFLEIEGGRVSGTLTIRPVFGSEFAGSFDSSQGLLATGRGEARGEGFRLELSYGGECPGRMALTGRWESAAFRLTGSVRASDCTGVAVGTFLFGSD